MVKRATEAENRPKAAFPTRNDIFLRRISSFALMGALLTIMVPFSPMSWIIPTEGPELLDRFMAPPVLLGALFFQWQIAGITMPLVIEVLDVAYVYRHSMYWPLAFGEFAVCVVVGQARNEILRRVTTVAVAAALWLLGWAATPTQHKREAWEHVKWVWMWMAFDEARGAVRRRRRW